MSAEPSSQTHSGIPSDTVNNTGSDLSVLACSRCDGPVNSDDLVEGLAVRIDGLTVCEMCIETLSPALRIQINRVRALKGLAVVTYRVARRQHPDHHFYSFTSAGLLLLHRRALVHGTEFATPDLPADHRPLNPSISGPRAATVQIHSTPERSKLTLLLGLSAAGVVVIGGIITVVLSGGAPRQSIATVVPTHSAPTLANDPRIEPTAIPALPTISPLPSMPKADEPASKRELKDYRAQFPDEIAALRAGVTDDAAPEVILALERDVLARGRANVDRLTRILQQPSLGRRELDEIDAVLARSQPPERPAFSDLRQRLSALSEIVSNKRALLMVAVTPPVSDPPPATPDTKDNSEASPEASPQENPPANQETISKPDGSPKPLVAIRPKVSLWTGVPGPKPATSAELTDTNTRIPSPWPFFIGDVPPRFAAAVKIRTIERKEVFALQLIFSAEQVHNGGIYVTLHPRIGRKELVLTRPDLPTEAPQKLNFIDRENWQGFSYRVNNPSGESVTIQIADVAESTNDPFWLGATAAIANGDPATLADELSPSPLLTPNPLLDWKPLLESLKAAARGRKFEQKWFDQKTLNTSAIKILGPDTISASKLNAALRLRREIPDVENQIEVVNLRDVNEIRKLFVPKANPGLFNQKTIPATVFLVTNGIEATEAPADWAKHVRAMNDLFRVGEAKLPATGFVPVWVIGNLDGSPLSTQPWSMLRTDRSVVMIDLTTAPVEGAESASKSRSNAYNYLAEGISTLMYQLRMVQVVQRSR